MIDGLELEDDMGDMADMAYNQVEREQGEIFGLLSETDAELFKRSAGARHAVVKSIRKYFTERGKLSDKQRYVLAMWILQHKF